jgi:uncharacterized protein YukE
MLLDLKKQMNPLDYEAIPDDTLMSCAPGLHWLPFHIGDIGTGSKSGPTARTPLQAADILAYSFARRSKQLRYDDLADSILGRMERRIDHRSHFWTGESLKRVFEKNIESLAIEDQRRNEVYHFQKFLRRMGVDVRKTDTRYVFEIPEDWDLPEDLEKYEK